MPKTQLNEFSSVMSQAEGGGEGREVGRGGKSKNAISVIPVYFGRTEACACVCTYMQFIVKLKCPIIQGILLTKSHLWRSLHIVKNVEPVILLWHERTGPKIKYSNYRRYSSLGVLLTEAQRIWTPSGSHERVPWIVFYLLLRSVPTYWES